MFGEAAARVAILRRRWGGIMAAAAVVSNLCTCLPGPLLMPPPPTPSSPPSRPLRQASRPLASASLGHSPARARAAGCGSGRASGTGGNRRRHARPRRRTCEGDQALGGSCTPSHAPQGPTHLAHLAATRPYGAAAAAPSPPPPKTRGTPTPGRCAGTSPSPDFQHDLCLGRSRSCPEIEEADLVACPGGARRAFLARVTFLKQNIFDSVSRQPPQHAEGSGDHSSVFSFSFSPNGFIAARLLGPVRGRPNSWPGDFNIFIVG